MIKLKMKNYSMISRTINKFEYIIGEEILPSNEKLIQQTKFTYSALGKAFE